MIYHTSSLVRITLISLGSAALVACFLTLSHLNHEHLSETRISSHITSLGASRFPPEPTRANATLDFGAILLLSLPTRTDRQDALSLIASITGLRLIMIPGVDGSTISHKAEPAGLPEDLRGPVLGIWRAHANAWRYIIENGIESALILEDDLDWDMNIKDIMGLWNWQLKYNNTIRWGQAGIEEGWEEGCPYGCDWDALYMGHCNNDPNLSRLDLHTTYHDPNGPLLSENADNFQKEITQVWNYTAPDADRLRIISPSWSPLCTQGYALSKMGALRSLYLNGGFKGLDSPVDLEMIWRLEEGKTSGYTLTPPAFTSWRTGGARDSDNDVNINATEVNKEGNAGGQSFGLKKSARKALKEYLKKDYWRTGVDKDY